MKPGGTYYSLTFQGNISTIKPLHSNVTSDLLVSHNSHPLWPYISWEHLNFCNFRYHSNM